jgi:hypothetical protein
MRNFPWGFDTTVRLGDGISKRVTWIPLYRDMTAGQACNESGLGRRILLDCRADLWAASGRYRAAEIPPYTVAAILRSERTLLCISRHINEIVGSVSQIQTLAVKSFTSSVGRQGALAITAVTTPRIESTAVTMPRIEIATRTTARTRIEMDTREQGAIRGVVAETLHQIVEATPGTRWKTRGSAREIRGTRKKVTTLEIGAASLRLIQRECAQVDDDYVSVCAFLECCAGS